MTKTTKTVKAWSVMNMRTKGIYEEEREVCGRRKKFLVITEDRPAILLAAEGDESRIMEVLITFST